MLRSYGVVAGENNTTKTSHARGRYAEGLGGDCGAYGVGVDRLWVACGSEASGDGQPANTDPAQHDVGESAVSYGGTQPDGPNHCDGSQRNNRAYSHSAAIVRCGTVNGYTVDADAATNDSHSHPAHLRLLPPTLSPPPTVATPTTTRPPMTATRPLTPSAPTVTRSVPTAMPAVQRGANCHPSYPEVCIPPPPPDLDCPDIPYRRFKVIPPDPHRFDGDKDGIGCESG